MPKELPQHRVLKIFIGSPGDLQEERKIARDVVQRVNKAIGRHLGVHVELRGWEDTLPGYTSRPQEKINEDLRECDIFLGLMWKRWGTPPRDDGEYTSGFEEEYHVALEQREADRMREIFLYFKEMPDALREDPGPQASKVLEFRRSVEQGRKVLFHTFEDAGEWEEVLRDHLDEHLAKNFAPVPEESEQGQRTRQTDDETETGLIEAGASLEQILGMLQDPEAEVSYLQIARSSLYTTSLLYNKIHTDHLLGTGEIQYLYAHKEQIELEKPEGWLILRSLLGDRKDWNVGWYWIDPDEERLPDLLAYLAANDDLESIQMQALRLLETVSTNTYRETIHRIVEEAEDSQKVKALSQFATSAREADLEFLRPIATEEEGDLAEAAWRGVLVALSHQDPNAAVDWIVETSGPQRGHFKDVLNRVLEDADSDHVRELLSVEDESARFKAMEAVKGEMEEGELRDLTQDDNLDIAAAAFMELIARGHEVDEEEIDEQLDIKQKNGQSQSTSLLGQALANYPSQPKTYSHEDVLFELYKTRDEDDLRAEITWVSIKSPIRYAALADRSYEEFEETLKEDITSGFDRVRDRDIRQLREKYGTAADGMIEKIDEFDDFTRGKFYHAAFQVLAQHATPDDLEIARSFTRDPHQSVLKDTTLEYALDIIGQFGTEEDVDLIEPFVTSSRYSLRYKAASMLLELDPERRQEHALELLGQDDWKLKKLAFRYSLDEEDVLPIDSVRELLYESDEQTRLGALAYLVQKLDDGEIEDLLEDYPNADDFDFYYYDVICWLDRLVHAPDPIGEWYRDSLTERLEETKPIFDQL
jgi:hypothetical protein